MMVEVAGMHLCVHFTSVKWFFVMPLVKSNENLNPKQKLMSKVQ